MCYCCIRGKDSYYQVHVIKKILGLTPLLVTYDGNNWTKTGYENMRQMKEVFDCDHIIISPSVQTLKKLNKICFFVMGEYERCLCRNNDPNDE